MTEPRSSHQGTFTEIRPRAHRLPQTARIGRVRMAVSDLSRSRDFYTNVLGLTVLSEHEDGASRLIKMGVPGSAEALLELQSDPAVKSIAGQMRLGLYHAAYLLPSRESLSSFIQHLNSIGVPFGASDHLYSEAIYLTDPDGFSVEVYADRPHEAWQYDGAELLSGVFPLDLSKLPRVGPSSWAGVPQGTIVGHVHLFVDNLEQARAFYCRGMGFDLMTWRHPGALFVSAGGYHHHVGLNTWIAGSALPDQSEPRLLFWELALPNADAVEQVLLSLTSAGYRSLSAEHGNASVLDPWGTNVHLVSSLESC